jgi:TPR repeat protein
MQCEKAYSLRAKNTHFGSISVTAWTGVAREGLAAAAYQVTPFEEAPRLVVGPTAEIAMERCLEAVRLSLLCWEGSLDLGLFQLGDLAASPDLEQFVNAYMSQRYTSALRLAEPFARQRLPAALYIQGVLDVHALTVESDFRRGLLSLRQAAAQGEAGALETLHWLYLTGQGSVACSRRRARAYMRRALRAGLQYHPSGWISDARGLVRLSKNDVASLWPD